MCGLTGVALSPKSTAAMLDVANLYYDLLAATQTRGDHATGTAVLTQKGVTDTHKRALSAEKYLALKETERWIDSHFGNHPLIVLGHTRWATHNNRHLDSAAHPFTSGNITGAHNGIIRNYEQVERSLRRDGYRPSGLFQVDSEAAFAALDANKSAKKALEMLNGYFALTWIKGRSLYVARTPDAPLTIAYVPSLKLLAWNSERPTLTKSLARFGLDVSDATAVEFYDPKPGEIYKFVPSEFTANGSGVCKISTFDLPEGAGRGFNSARPTTTTTVVHRPKAWEGDEDYSSPYISVNGNLQRRDTFKPRETPKRGSWKEAAPQITLDAMRLANFDRQISALERQNTALLERVALLEEFLGIEEANAHATRDGFDDRAVMLASGVCDACGFRGDTKHPLRITDEGMRHAECEAISREPSLPLEMMR